MAVVTDMILGSGERLRGLPGCAPRSSAPVCAQGLRVSADATGHLPSLPGAWFRFVSDQVGTMSFTHGRRGRMSTSNLVRVFTEQELEDRRSAVVAELERRFGSLERALEREQDWDYDDDEARLFSEYRAVTFLLSD